MVSKHTENVSVNSVAHAVGVLVVCSIGLDFAREDDHEL